jgi:hypothetical protein
MDLNQKLNNFECRPPDQAWSAIEKKASNEIDSLYEMKIIPPEICWNNIAEKIGNTEGKINNSKSISSSYISTWIRYAAIITGVLLLSIGLFNPSLRNKLFNTVIESNLKTSLSDTQYILPSNKKKSDTSIKTSVTPSMTPERKK